MKSLARWFVLASVGISASSALAEEPCDNPYVKAIPFKRSLTAQKVQLSIFNEARFAYDCNTVLADNRGGINLAFFKMNADVFTVQASATQKEEDAEVSVRTLLLGYELGSEHRVLSSLYDKTFSTNQDLDISDRMMVAIGPLPVQIRYGIEGSGQIRVTAGMKKLGTQIGVIPSSRVRAYIQAGTDVQIVSASARGALQVLEGKLDNKLALQYKSKDRRHGVKVAATSFADFSALEGSVLARAEARTGKETKVYENELFKWEGQRLAGKIFDFSEDVSMPPAPGKKEELPAPVDQSDDSSQKAHSVALDSEAQSMTSRMDAWE